MEVVDKIEINRQTAYHNRIEGARRRVLASLGSAATDTSGCDVVFVDEIKPPTLQDSEIAVMAAEGLLVATTDYSQHIFRLAQTSDYRV